MKTIEYTISEADAVRHLIVCDTQFTWAGITNLTLEQMMDLQARGWVVEGDDNDEFQLTVAGEEVVARALQRGVPKTLADVQPGGRVRLVEHRGELDPTRIAETVGAREYGVPPYRYFAFTTAQLAAFAAALSAQPSPGGQGDALPPLPAEVDSVVCMIRGEKDMAEPLDYYYTADQMRAYAQAALAARQPVGEPVAWIHTHIATGRVEFGLSPMYDCDFNAVQWDSVALYAAKTAQAVGEAVELARAKVKIAALELQLATYEAPTQAVDLGQEHVATLTVDDNGMLGWSLTQIGRDLPEGEYRLALIDSQAVGK